MAAKPAMLTCAVPVRPPFPPSSVPARETTAVGESLAEDFAVLDLGTGDYFSLGEVGGFIWDRLDGETTLAEIASAMARAFDVGEDQAAADLDLFIAALTDRGLVRIVAGE